MYGKIWPSEDEYAPGYALMLSNKSGRNLTAAELYKILQPASFFLFQPLPSAQVVASW